MDNDTKARLDRVREAARTLIEERDWFRQQADMIDAALRALGVDVPHANANPSSRPSKPPTKQPGKRAAYLSATEYRSNLDLIESALAAGPMDIAQIRKAMTKFGRLMTYGAVASLCSKGTTSGRLRRVGVGVYRLPCQEHELTSHFGEMPMSVVDLPREANDLTAAVPPHLLNDTPPRDHSILTIDPETGRREYATDYHEDEHEGEGE